MCPHQRQRSHCKECREEADKAMSAGLEGSRKLVVECCRKKKHHERASERASERGGEREREGERERARERERERARASERERETLLGNSVHASESWELSSRQDILIDRALILAKIVSLD